MQAGKSYNLTVRCNVVAALTVSHGLVLHPWPVELVAGSRRPEPLQYHPNTLDITIITTFTSSTITTTTTTPAPAGLHPRVRVALLGHRVVADVPRGPHRRGPDLHNTGFRFVDYVKTETTWCPPPGGSC